MKGTDIIGYAYEADLHCPECAEKRFGVDPGKIWVRKGAVDREGNQVHPIFVSDEHDPEGEYCGDCRAEIWEKIKE